MAEESAWLSQSSATELLRVAQNLKKQAPDLLSDQSNWDRVKFNIQIDANDSRICSQSALSNLLGQSEKSNSDRKESSNATDPVFYTVIDDSPFVGK